jgi:hypothetical protein
MKVHDLVARSATQRAALIGAARPILEKATAVDRVVTHVRHHPVASSLAIGAIALLGPRKIVDLGARALTVYALLRR